MSEKTFLVHWFSGVDHFFENAAPDALAQFVGACASACSASYSRGIYEQALFAFPVGFFWMLRKPAPNKDLGCTK